MEMHLSLSLPMMTSIARVYRFSRTRRVGKRMCVCAVRHFIDRSQKYLTLADSVHPFSVAVAAGHLCLCSMHRIDCRLPTARATLSYRTHSYLHVVVVVGDAACERTGIKDHSTAFSIVRFLSTHISHTNLCPMPIAHPTIPDVSAS